MCARVGMSDGLVVVRGCNDIGSLFSFVGWVWDDILMERLLASFLSSQRLKKEENMFC